VPRGLPNVADRPTLRIATLLRLIVNTVNRFFGLESLGPLPTGATGRTIAEQKV